MGRHRRQASEHLLPSLNAQVLLLSSLLVWFTVWRGVRWRSDFLPPCSQQSSVSWVRDLWTFSGLVFFTEASSCPYAVLTLLFPYKPGVFHRCSSTVPSSSERTPSFSASICIDTHAESIGNKDRKSAQSLPPKSTDFSLLYCLLI